MPSYAATTGSLPNTALNSSQPLEADTEMKPTPVVCFVTGSSGDWGGASRVLYTTLRQMDRSRLEPLLLLPSSGPIVTELENLQLRHLIWGPLTEPGNLRTYLGAFFRAVALFRRERVALVHINGSNFWRPAEVLAAWVLRIPIVAHYHVINDRPGPWMRLCRAAIAVSRYTAEKSLPAKLERPVIYNPVNLKRFDAGQNIRASLGLEQDNVVVSFLGQIREIKGVQDFIAMARRIEDSNVRFLIAGECRDPEKFSGSYTQEDIHAMIGNDERIRYIGYVGRVEDIYHSSDIIVMPSRWEEPLGLISLEAGACGKPVVATRVGGIPEIIEDGHNGFLVPPGDVDSLVRHVDDLVQNRERRISMGIAGRKLVERDFTQAPIRRFEDLLLKFSAA